MSLGNNVDDADFERHAILQEAAVQIVLNKLPPNDAIDVGQRLVVRQLEAEQSGQVVTDEQGNPVSYHDASLNPARLSESQREEVDRVYQELCEREGLDAR